MRKRRLFVVSVLNGTFYEVLYSILASIALRKPNCVRLRPEECVGIFRLLSGLEYELR